MGVIILAVFRCCVPEYVACQSIIYFMYLRKKASLMDLSERQAGLVCIRKKQQVDDASRWLVLYGRNSPV